ncbi:hypothetical protein BHE74_00018610 [Ensete ventricosum]|nr:hypothetical protein BHE74_00018610 [Ensete ventricosum]RZR97562.1 hypothetical protein BHM03_00026761 [Ensete ventricosum]
MVCHALAPCRYSRTSSIRLGHIPRDDKGKAGCTGKLPSHRYKTLTPTARFLLTWASEGPLWVTPPISKEAFVQDRHPRDGPRDKSTEPCVEDPRGSINPHRKFRPLPMLADLRTRTKTSRADTSARLMKVL